MKGFNQSKLFKIYLLIFLILILIMNMKIVRSIQCSYPCSQRYDYCYCCPMDCVIGGIRYTNIYERNCAYQGPYAWICIADSLIYRCAPFC